MVLSMQQPFILLPPTTKQPPAPAVSAGSARAYFPRSRRRPRELEVYSRPSDLICTKNIIQDTKLPRAGKFFELEMTARDGEIDLYGVVNNAIYARYIEIARQEMLASFGVCAGSIARTGRAMAVSELNVKYFAPLKRGAKFVVMVRVVGIKGVRMLMEHVIATLPERQLVLEAMATIVCLNKDYRPTRMFRRWPACCPSFSHPN